MFCFLKSLLAWLGLALLGINLIGFILRYQFVIGPTPPSDDEKVRRIIESEMTRQSIAGMVVSLLALVATILIGRFLYGKSPVLLAVLLVSMMGRIPVLYHEIKYSPEHPHSTPVVVLTTVGMIANFVMLPTVWYFLCQ